MLRILPWPPIFVLASLAVAVAAQERQPERLTLADTFGRNVRFDADVPTAVFHASGRVRVVLPGAQRSGPADVGVRWFDAATGAAAEPPPEPAAAASDSADVPDVPPLRVRTVDGTVVVTRGKEVVRRLPGAREQHLAPDLGYLSYVVDNDLHVVELRDDAEPWAVTEDGGPDRFHGVLDWVYQEEIYGRNDFQGHWWSPDSTRVAFLSLDESPVKDFVVVDHVPTARLADERSVLAEVVRYPKAGDPNPIVSVSVADVAARRVVPIDLGRYEGEEILVVRVGWTPDGSAVLLEIQNRIQDWLELVVADPATGSIRTVLREESTTWVNRLDPPRFLSDGSFLWSSERTDFRNLYRYALSGELLATVTQVGWNVLDVVRVDEAAGRVWFVGRGTSAIDRHLFRVPLRGGEPEQLTQGPGTHRVTWSPYGRSFLDTVSSLQNAPEVRLCDADGKILASFGSVPSPDLRRYGFRPPELLSISARDGYPMDATLLVPDAARGEKSVPFPVFVDTYSGPDSPSVQNRFRPSVWHRFLAQEGIGVLQVNVRSASGRGQIAIGTCHRQLGVQELADIEDAVASVCRERGGDPERVGISGWSYGGFMAAYALTHSDAFRLGIAGAGVYDWQLYDTIYTERYMQTPQLNPDGYARSSVIEAADRLRGHLVILHGTKDDNVHLQNAIRLVDALQRAGKDSFELMLYPRSRHGVRSPEQRAHMRRLIWRAIDTHLRPVGRVAGGQR